jgi:hypothetical protein
LRRTNKSAYRTKQQHEQLFHLLFLSKYCVDNIPDILYSYIRFQASIKKGKICIFSGNIMIFQKKISSSPAGSVGKVKKVPYIKGDVNIKPQRIFRYAQFI